MDVFFRKLAPFRCRGKRVDYQEVFQRQHQTKSGRCTTVFGQTRSPERDELQEIIDKYVNENPLSDRCLPPQIHVRKYLQYIEDNHITDPSVIPGEVLNSFMRTEKTKTTVD